MNGRCAGCGEELWLDFLELWPEEEAFLLDACCEERQEELHEGLVETLTMSPQERHDYLAPLRELFGLYGIRLRDVYWNEREQRWGFDRGLEVRPVELEVANALIERQHAHNGRILACLFALGAYNGDELVAVATVERPRSRMICERSPGTVEVTRLCVDRELDPQLVWNACSTLYGAAAREAKKRGADRVITYTLEREAGTTLKAVGWHLERKTRDEKWSRDGRPRADRGPAGRKYRWARYLTRRGAPRQAELFAA